MSSKKTLVLLVVAAVMLCSAVAVWAAFPDPRMVWSTYHANGQRTGQNPDSNNVTDPSRLRLIWVFPRTAINAPTEAEATKSPTSFVGWTTDADGVFTSADKYMPNFYYIDQVGLASTAQAVWQFAPTAALPAAKYFIDVRVPGSFTGSEAATRRLTTQAVYQVIDAEGTHGPFVVDQTDQSGSWVRLTDQAFDFQTAAHRVILQNNAPGGVPFPNATVVADAIRYVPAANTGMEVYASPAEAEFSVHWKFGGGDQFKNSAQFVFSGTIETPFSPEATAPDSGAAYCIKAVTPTNGLAAGITDGLRRQVGDYLWRYPRMSTDPQPPAGAGALEAAKRAARAIEGPVENGFYSSPTIAYVDLGTPSAPDVRQVVFMTGMDRQVYAFDAKGWEEDEFNPNISDPSNIIKRPPRLLWKGPGLTVSEPYEVLPANWTAVAGRDDAFGGQFLFTNCDPATPRTTEWNFPAVDRKAAGEPANPDGWAYHVYVWIPVVKGGELAAGRVSDAAYTVTYAAPSTGGETSVTKEVRIDQNDRKYQGRWVDLGSYYKPSKVELSNKSADTNAVNKAVIADAAMIVPETMLGFDKCTPVADVNNTKDRTGAPADLATTVFLTNPNGRVFSMDAASGKVNWIYPKVRTKLVVAGSAEADEPSLGNIASSPAYYRAPDGGKLFVSTMDGEVYSLVDLGTTAPTVAWQFPDATLATPDTEEPAGFSSSPTIDVANGQIFTGTQDGVVYSLKLNPNVAGTPAVKQSQLLWKYPQDATASTMPLGGVQFSTAAIGDITGAFPHRSWIGSMDGKVWSFDMAAGTTGNGNERRLDIAPASATSTYQLANLGSAIMGSVALDNFPNSPTAFVGDMGTEGILHWFDAKTGGQRATWGEYNGYKFLGPLFSSPAIVDSVLFADKYSASDPVSPFTYIVVGQASSEETPFNGRIYALAQNVEGGQNPWDGQFFDPGYWPFDTDPNTQPMVEVKPLEDASVPEFDMFPAGKSGSAIEKLYQNSLDRNPGLVSSTDTPPDANFYDPDASPAPDGYYTGAIPDNPDDWILSKDMKVAPAPTGGWDPTDNATRLSQIQQVLKDQARLRRRQVADPSKASGKVEGNARNGIFYYEWGEKINLIIWNLPGLADLSGGDGGNVASAKNNIRILLNNKSSGQSAGAEQVFRPKVLWRYTVLDSSQTDGAGKYRVLYQNVEQTKKVERCFAVAQIEIKGTGTRPLSPGSEWYVTAEVSLKSGGVMRIPLAELKPGTVAGTTVPVPDPDKNQTIGINNAIAITDDTGRSGGAGAIAWTATPSRNTAEAHFNGNDYINASSQLSRKMPVIDFYSVAHGTGSRVARLGVMDRSATGLDTGAEINRFRIAGGELGYWGAVADNAVIARSQGLQMGVKMPWELGLNSIDYPGIPARAQEFRSAYSDRDPSSQHTTMPPIAAGASYDTSTLRPDTVTVHVNVPRYQPANNLYGYRRKMNAFVDSNGNGRLDTGYNTRGRQSLFQEAYRTFEVDIKVPPDPRIEVSQQLIDTGMAPHGLGEPDGNLTIPVSRFTAYNDLPEIQSWFKKFTVKNTGNVNLFNVRVDKGVNLFNGDGSPVIINGDKIVSSLDETMAGININPGDELSTAGLGFTLTKPRVGDADPSIMTIPDMRKFESYGLDGSGVLGTWPLLDPKVSVRVPISQPVGSYTAPVVRVFADLDGNEVRDPGEPFSDPGFQLKVAVKEAQITGRPSDANQLNAVRPELMIPNLADPKLPAGYPKVGVTTPAAYRDPATGRVNLFFSTNQPANPADYPNWNNPADPSLRTFANAPWFLQKAVLDWGGAPSAWFIPYSDGRWWNYQPATGRIPAFQWPVSLLNARPGAFLESWPASGAATKSVRHQSPAVAENLDVPVDALGRTWLIWQGLGNVRNPDGTMTTESRLFYGDASGGALVNDTTGIQAIDLGPGMVKRTPTMVAAGNRLWALWAGSVNGNWNLYYSVNDGASPAAHPASAWTEVKALLTPNALSSVSAPNAVQRLIWQKLPGSRSGYASNQQRLLDVVYTGINRVTQNADILMTRYLAVGPDDAAQTTAGPDRKGQPFARVYGERLEKHPRYGFYTSKHIAWMRLVPEKIRSGAQLPIVDNWNGSVAGAAYSDLPFVHVILGAGYAYPAGTHVSATDGSVTQYNPDGSSTVIQAGAPITPTVDKSTGVFTYDYPDGSPAKTILGSTLIDPSAGVVRFTKPLKEQSGSITTAWAEYTPQTLRLTTDRAVDNSPKAFIERSPMTPLINPGMGAWVDGTGSPLPAPSVDRLWVLWRKASSGMDVSTIYYRTMRVGVDLSKIPGATAIGMNPTGVPVAPVTVTDNLGAWELDKSGTKIYFTEVDERYRSIANPDSGSPGVMGPGPGPITISYVDYTGASRTVTTGDVSWIQETPEQSLLGFAAEGNINEDSISAFADPLPPNNVPKIWVFWTSTRGGNSDLFWATFAQSSMK